MIHVLPGLLIFFFFNDTATTEIYTLSLHDALPISCDRLGQVFIGRKILNHMPHLLEYLSSNENRSEEHTSELQSLRHLVCRLLLEKKKNTHKSFSSPM